MWRCHRRGGSALSFTCDFSSHWRYCEERFRLEIGFRESTRAHKASKNARLLCIGLELREERGLMLAVATREQPQDVDLFVTLADRESESAASSPALDADDLDESAALTPKQSFEGDEEDGETRTNEACEQDSKALEAEAFEPEDPLERSLQRMLQTRCFSGLDGKTTSYLYTTQLTHSNVVSTVVTSRPFNLKRRQNSLLALNNSNNNDSDTNSKPDGGGLLERKKGPVGGDGGSQATHVYGQPCNPKKVRNQQKGKYQAQLPAFRRSLPSLPIPVSRLNQELIQVCPLNLGFAVEMPIIECLTGNLQ